MAIQKADLIGRAPLFRGLSSEELQALGMLAVEKRFASGTTLFYEGEECEGMFIISQGRVKIFKTSAGGREITIALEGAPSTVAELPVFDGGPYPASVSALEETTTLFIDKRGFQKLCRQYPDIALKVLAAIGNRLRYLIQLLEGVTFGSIRQRLARLLLETSAEAGQDAFTLPATQQELASRLGTVREVVSRNLSRFQMDGMIRSEGRQVRIVDRQALEREAESEL